jgi:hypothetical protein
VVNVATPSVRVLVPMDVDPLKKVTVPVGTPPWPETVAANVTLIPVPAVRAEEVSVVALAIGAAATVNEKDATAVTGVLSESATWMAKVKGPAAAGVPEMTPVEAASDNPGGRLPETTLQV